MVRQRDTAKLHILADSSDDWTVVDRLHRQCQLSTSLSYRLRLSVAHRRPVAAPCRRRSTDHRRLRVGRASWWTLSRRAPSNRVQPRKHAPACVWQRSSALDFLLHGSATDSRSYMNCSMPHALQHGALSVLYRHFRPLRPRPRAALILRRQL